MMDFRAEQFGACAGIAAAAAAASLFLFLVEPFLC